MNIEKKKINKKYAVSWVIVILIMIIIFRLSSQVAAESNSLSTGITTQVYRIIIEVFPKWKIDIITFNHFIRKNAHFFIFSVLGFFLCNALASTNKKIGSLFIHTVLIGVLYASFDEFYQSFIPGRGPSLSDVILDSSGVVFGTLIYIILLVFKGKKS